MIRILAIDPGRDTGWAIFEGPHLINADCSSSSGNGVAVELRTRPIDVLVIELPQVYNAKTSKADPNDLITLARCVGRYEERFAHASRIELIHPRDWKGTIPKDVFTKRIEAALTPAEKATIEKRAKCTAAKRHNMLDAIGLGKWWLTRERLYSATRA